MNLFENQEEFVWVRSDYKKTKMENGIQMFPFFCSFLNCMCRFIISLSPFKLRGYMEVFVGFVGKSFVISFHSGKSRVRER